VRNTLCGGVAARGSAMPKSLCKPRTESWGPIAHGSSEAPKLVTSQVTKGTILVPAQNLDYT
jgi:hypothetical protein